MYVLLFLVGFFGFLGMAGLSFLHSGHDSHTGNHGSTGEALGSLRTMHGHGQARGAHPAPHPAAKGATPTRSRAARAWWALSPLDLFAYCLGAGATGELMKATLAPLPLTGVAVLGALLFNLGIVRPLMGTLLRFASPESRGLEGQVAQPAEAVTRFDENGRGLVRLSMDGEVVQLLATLEPDERTRGVRVARGDSVLVVGVDVARNTCRVTRELTP